MAELLYEIGTEELPAGYLEPALEQLAHEVRRRLEENRLGAQAVRAAGTPRRLTVAVSGIAERQAPERTRIVGPPAKAAFDEQGRPTAAAQGFARSKGVPLEALKVEETDRGPYVVAFLEQEGKTARELLPDLLRDATAAISFPKSMRWEPSGFPFARPIRWLVALLDDQVLDLSIAGVQAGRATRGHPFLSPGEIELPDASYEHYADRLRSRHVLVEVAERKGVIRTQINAIMARYGTELRDSALLDEVANMVEHPHALEGSFDDHFLSVPSAVLSEAMKEHQRYFPVHDAQGRLLPRFVTVSNRTADQDEQVREGNERVLLARLEDAKFFWEEDRKLRLDELVPRLKGVVFLGGLGNNLQRTERLVDLAGRIAEKIGPPVSLPHVRRAARLCKADLLTGLVGELPGLQGIVGKELALAAGEPKPVAQAIAEHYLPAGADDALPASLEGTALALADRLDVIVGCFSLGLLPSGSQDPYALRRNALGTLLIIERGGLPLRLDRLMAMARSVAEGHGIHCTDQMAAQVLDFFRDRLYNAAIERGFRHDFVRAVLASGYYDVRAFWARLSALAECSRRPWWPALVELVDRTYRIHRDVEQIVPVREELLSEPLEKELAEVLKQHRDDIARLIQKGDYVEAAERYTSAFARAVHDFFEEVFVNVEDQAVRLNRKSLCGWICRLFADGFADLYLIETAAQGT
jgi:glycyl-tRNA synthetase beta chain